MTTDTPTPVSDLTAADMMYSLTGFDEIAIAARFNSTLSDLRQKSRAIDLGRALAFVHMRRHDGLSDKDAWTAAQELTIFEVTHFFVRPPAAEAAPKKKKKKKRDVDPSPADVADAEGKG